MTVLQIPFKHECKKTQPGCKKDIIEGRKPIHEEVLPRKPIVIGEMELGEDQNHILIEIVAYHLGYSLVTIPTMNHEKPLQEFEL